VIGGLGGAVAEVVVQSHPVRMRLVGLPGEFAPTGSPAFLFEHFGLTPEHIRQAATRLVEETAGVAHQAHPGR
jgi:transketolase